jgi:citrate synthase
MTETAKLQVNGRTFDLPVIEGSEGERAIDIRKLRAQSGLITLDSGFGNSGACESAITFVDGEKGILRYRGYSIEDLCENSSFLEVAYLLIFGELPNREERNSFVGDVTRHSLIHENLRQFFQGFPLKAHPMAILSATMTTLSTFYQDSYNALDPEHSDLTVRRILAKIPTIAACSYKKSIGQPFAYPRNDLSYSANLLHMLFSVPCEAYHVDPIAA